MRNNYTIFRPNIKEINIKKSYILDNIYHVEAKRIDKRPLCCGRKMNIKDYRIVHIKDTNYGSKKVIIHVKKQRYICPCCQRKEMSKLDFVETRHSISKNIHKEMIWHLKKTKSFKQTGEELGISLSTVMRYFTKLKIREIKKSTKIIHFDEFKGNADNEKYQLAVYNGERELLTILKDRKSQTIKDYLNTLSEKPEKVVIDLFMQFRNIIKTTLPEAQIIADKYHYVRQFEWMIRDIRIRLYNHDIKYKDLKKYWKLLSKNPLELSVNQRNRVEKLRKLNKTFSECYGYKEEFYRLLKLETVKEFRAGLSILIKKLSESEIKESMKLGKTYQNWYEEIVNSFESKLDNGFVEGYNNKIKVIKRVSYGIKNFSTLKKLIQLKFYQYVDCFFDPTC
jgi:transposase